MNIHVLFYILANRKWHHRGRLHPLKKKGGGVGGRKGDEEIEGEWEEK